MTGKTFAKFIYETLTESGWPGLVLDEDKQSVKTPIGEILSLKKGEYHLNFFWYSTDNEEYSVREKFSEIVFPNNYDISEHLYFRANGNFTLSRERQFKNIINPLGKNIKTLRLTRNTTRLKFYKEGLSLPIETFTNAIEDAEYIYRKSNSYRSSTENYLSNIKSRDYSKNVRKRITYIEKGEFNFLVDKLYLKSKRRKNDFLKYLNGGDLKSVEDLITELLRYDVLTDDFLRKLNDYLIKEKLKDIIQLGKDILLLGTTNLTTLQAKKIIKKMELTGVRQLETLWQKYFEQNLLYLIFTYKKIFPKVKLKDVEGDKKYPDFIGINHYNGLDIIEIKTHLKNALVWDNSHKNFYFSPEMSKAIVQTTNYLDAIMQERFMPEDREKITNFTDEENLYHPRGIIVISSQKKLTTKTGKKETLKRDFTKLRNSLHNIEILTFDDIINIADEYIKNIVPQVEDI